VSFITSAPPLPLDTYVNVEGFQNSSKKRIPKQHSTATINEDILKGVNLLHAIVPCTTYITSHAWK